MDHKVLVEELIRGRNTAVKLLEQAQASPETPPDPVLLKEVLGSFSNVLSALEVAAPDSSPPKVELTTSCCSEENSKKRKAQSAPKRNGHRRRSSSDVCRTVLKTTEDGYTWRKYGQKEIYGAKFPRSYFRCTHKYDRDCQALRQVQQSEEDPSMYEITYFGEHTCMQLHTTSADSSGHIKAACIIDFAASKATGEMINCAAVHHQLETPFASTAAAAAAAHADAALPQPKQECEEEVLSNLTPGAASSSDLLSVSDFPGFEEASFQYDVSSSLVLYPLDEFPDIF